MREKKEKHKENKTVSNENTCKEELLEHTSGLQNKKKYKIYMYMYVYLLHVCFGKLKSINERIQLDKSLINLRRSMTQLFLWQQPIYLIVFDRLNNQLNW